jgi:hypothetical protein
MAILQYGQFIAPPPPQDTAPPSTPGKTNELDANNTLNQIKLTFLLILIKINM